MVIVGSRSSRATTEDIPVLLSVCMGERKTSSERMIQKIDKIDVLEQKNSGMTRTFLTKNLFKEKL